MAEKTAKTVRLGQEAFVVMGPEGRIERTMVARIDQYGYEFFNGMAGEDGVRYDFAGAVEEADRLLALSEAALRARLKTVRARRRSLGSEEHLEEVLKSRFTVRDLRGTDDYRRVRNLRNVVVPEQYFLPGDTVYVAVVPWTRVRAGFSYRPYQYFVLETVVRAVCLTGYGDVHYTLTTPFEVDECFASIEAAEEHLQGLVLSGPVSPVMFVPHTEEKEELKRLGEEAGPPF